MAARRPGRREAGGGEAEFVRADLESPDDVRALAERAAEVDILLNNAGVFPVGATHERTALRTRRPRMGSPASARKGLRASRFDPSLCREFLPPAPLPHGLVGNRS